MAVVLADDVGGRLEVDVDDSSRLIDGLHPQRHDSGGKDGSRNEGEDLPAMPAQYPEIVRQRHLG